MKVNLNIHINNNNKKRSWLSSLTFSLYFTPHTLNAHTKAIYDDLIAGTKKKKA
jgi:hypothetical protein